MRAPVPRVPYPGNPFWPGARDFRRAGARVYRRKQAGAVVPYARGTIACCATVYPEICFFLRRAANLVKFKIHPLLLARPNRASALASLSRSGLSDGSQSSPKATERCGGCLLIFTFVSCLPRAWRFNTMQSDSCTLARLLCRHLL